MDVPTAAAVIRQLELAGIETTPRLRTSLEEVLRQAELDSVTAFAASAWSRALRHPHLEPLGGLIGRVLAQASFGFNRVGARLTDREEMKIEQAVRRGALSHAALTELLGRRAKRLKF